MLSYYYITLYCYLLIIEMLVALTLEAPFSAGWSRSSYNICTECEAGGAAPSARTAARTLRECRGATVADMRPSWQKVENTFYLSVVTRRLVRHFFCGDKSLRRRGQKRNKTDRNISKKKTVTSPKCLVLFFIYSSTAFHQHLHS